MEACADINPTLVICFFTRFPDPVYHRIASPRTVGNYEIEYLLSADHHACTLIDDEVYVLRAGDICIRRPGQITVAYGTYESFSIQFDLSGQYNPNTKRNKNYDDILYIKPTCTHPLVQALPVIMRGTKEIRIIMETIIANHSVKKEYEIFSVRTDVLNLFRLLFDQCRKTDSPIDQVLAYIRDHFTEPITVASLIERSGFSKAYFHHIFKQATSTSPNQYIRALRIKFAKALIETEDIPIADIAIRSGYRNETYFQRVFTKETGCSPLQYRKRL